MDDTMELAGLGHNNPPPDMPYHWETHAALRAKALRFQDTFRAWRELGTIQNETQAARLTDFIAGARAASREIDDRRVLEKAPYDAAAKAVQAAFDPMLKELERITKASLAMQNDWLARERARVQAIKAQELAEAQRAAAEVAARIAAAEAAGDGLAAEEARAEEKAAAKAIKAAAAPVKVSAGSATGGGKTISTRTQKNVEIDDLALAFAAVREDPAVVDAIRAALLRVVRAKAWDGQPIPGVRVVTTESAA